MKRLYLLQDTRDVITYREYIGFTRKRKIKSIFTKRVKLYDPSIQKYRKQRVNLKVINNKSIIIVEVI